MPSAERLNFWKDKKVLVTGSTGVVGLNLVKKLVGLNADVVALVRDWVPRTLFHGSWLQENSAVTTVRGQLEDCDLIMRTLAEYEIQCIFHLGAQAIVTVGNRSPVTTFRANIEGTWNLLEAARVLNCYSDEIEAICIASSDKAYGTSSVLPYVEGMALSGEHPYDVSKSCADLIAQCYGKTYQLPVAIARMGNIYGPGDLNFNRIIPGTIKDILEQKCPEIRSDGTPVREYFFVADAVNAYLTLAENTVKQSFRGEAFNFSSGEKLTVLEVVRKIATLMHSDREPRVLNTSRNEILEQYLSIEKAKFRLGWEPLYDLEKGLEETIPWYKSMLG